MRTWILSIIGFCALLTGYSQTPLTPPLPAGSTYYKGKIVSQQGVGVIGCTNLQLILGDGSGCVTIPNGINLPPNTPAVATDNTGIPVAQTGAQAAAQIAGQALSPAQTTIGATVELQTGTLTAAEALLPSGGTLDIKGQLTISTTHSTPANITLKFEQGGSIQTNGYALTIVGPLQAGRSQIFFGGGIVSFNAGTVEYTLPEWWGADNTGTLPSAIAWQSAINAALTLSNGTAGSVSCGSGYYLIENTLYVAGNTAQGVGIVGPNASGYNSCRLMWDGYPGGTLLHVLGGHYAPIQNVSFASNVANGHQLGRSVWYDSNNGATGASVNISTLVRSSNLDTVTTTGAHGYHSGSNITIAGASNSTFNGVHTVWYAPDSTHLVFEDTAANASATGGTASWLPYGDTIPQMTDSGVALDPIVDVPISSMSISSNVLSATLSSPVLLHPHQWVRITGSTDVVYNAYWQIATVTDPTTFTATATYVASEATATTGNMEGPNSGVVFGTNDPSLTGNSIAIARFKGVNVTSANYALGGLEFDDLSNTKDFSFDTTLLLGLRMGVMGNTQNLHFMYTYAENISDAIYGLGSGGGNSIERDLVENTGAYYIASFVASGSYNASTNGTNGQFEVCQPGVQQNSLRLTSNRVEVSSYASDGVAVSTCQNLTMISNDFFDGASTPPYIEVGGGGPIYPGGGQTVTSIGNSFANARSWTSSGITVTKWAPFVTGNPAVLTPVVGSAPSGNTYNSIAITSIGDMTGDASTGFSFTTLNNTSSFTHITQLFNVLTNPGNYQQVGTQGLFGCYNNVVCGSARNAAQNGDDTFMWDSSEFFTVTGAGAKFPSLKLNSGTSTIYRCSGGTNDGWVGVSPSTQATACTTGTGTLVNEELSAP